MSRLTKWLESRGFYEKLQAYRHSPHGNQQVVSQLYNDIINSIFEAAGERLFVITHTIDTATADGVGKPAYYHVQLCHSPTGNKAWDGFEVPVECLGPDILKPGTKLTIKVET